MGHALSSSRLEAESLESFKRDDVELRELRLQGFKPKALETGPGKTLAIAPSLVMHKGPLASVGAEDGTVFERGLIRAQLPEVAAALRSGHACARTAQNSPP